MADVTISDSALQIDLTVPERVLSLHGAGITVPLDTIRGVRIVRDVLDQVRGVRTPGARFPGVLAIGTWRGSDGGRLYRDFVLVHRAGPGLVITTDGEYDRILLGTETSDGLAEQLGACAVSPD